MTPRTYRTPVWMIVIWLAWMVWIVYLLVKIAMHVHAWPF